MIGFIEFSCAVDCRFRVCFYLVHKKILFYKKITSNSSSTIHRNHTQHNNPISESTFLNKTTISFKAHVNPSSTYQSVPLHTRRREWGGYILAKFNMSSGDMSFVILKLFRSVSNLNYWFHTDRLLRAETPNTRLTILPHPS